ncbi:MAG: hypothetical protein R3E67_03600 [Pseudomonadales bacterium]
MKYWISLVNTTEVDQFVAIAQKAEELGYEGITVPDHLVYPRKLKRRIRTHQTAKCGGQNPIPGQIRG